MFSWFYQMHSGIIHTGAELTSFCGQGAEWRCFWSSRAMRRLFCRSKAKWRILCCSGVCIWKGGSTAWKVTLSLIGKVVGDFHYFSVALSTRIIEIQCYYCKECIEIAPRNQPEVLSMHFKLQRHCKFLLDSLNLQAHECINLTSSFLRLLFIFNFNSTFSCWISVIGNQT